jgi:DNA ligase D-like protein (predicted polymerase)
VVALRFPSGRRAEEVVPHDAAALVWMANLACLELHPHPVRAGDLDHPDELRVDLDPGPGVGWADVRAVALEVKSLLDEVGLRGWPKTSGSRGMHVNVRIEPRWKFDEVRRAAVALSRAVERRVPALASSKWWKEERHGVFLDYNQNAKDRTTCSAYSVRPLPDARVSAPLAWDEVPDCEPAAFTILTMPERFRQIGDPHAGMNDAAGSLEPLLELAAKDQREGLGDAPWPPHFRKMEGEAPRVAPSRRKAAEPAPRAPSRIKMPLIVVAHSPNREAALAGLERWKSRHTEAAGFLAVDDVLVDSMRGRSSTWTRVRVNLRHVPEELRPPQETPDPDDDPTREWRAAVRSPKRAAKHE